MAYNALTDDATLQVLKWGYSTFTAGAGQTQVALNAGTVPIADPLPLKYNKIVAGVFTEMSAGEKTDVDDAEAAAPNPSMIFLTGTAETLQSSYHGRAVELTNALAIDLTVPKGLGNEFFCVLFQGGAGQVTLIGAATIKNRQSHTKLAGEDAEASLMACGGDVLMFAGDTA